MARVSPSAKGTAPFAGTLQVRRKRRATNYNFRIKKPVWQDPYPFIPGTEPEKRLFEVLVRRGIYFVFQDILPESVKKGALPTIYTPGFQPDFILTEYKMILDPFGIFHHSLKEATGWADAPTLEGRLGTDAIKSVLYRALGYSFYHPWWDDQGWLWQEGDGAVNKFQRIGFDTNAMVDLIPELKRPPTHKLKDPRDIAAKRFPGYRLGSHIGAGASSVAIANHLRTKQKPLRTRRRVRRSR